VLQLRLPPAPPTASMLEELDKAAQDLNASRRAVINTLVRQALDQHYPAQRARLPQCAFLRATVERTRDRGPRIRRPGTFGPLPAARSTMKFFVPIEP